MYIKAMELSMNYFKIDVIISVAGRNDIDLIIF